MCEQIITDFVSDFLNIYFKFWKVKLFDLCLLRSCSNILAHNWNASLLFLIVHGSLLNAKGFCYNTQRAVGFFSEALRYLWHITFSGQKEPFCHRIPGDVDFNQALLRGCAVSIYMDEVPN